MKAVTLHYLPNPNAIRDFGRQIKWWEGSLSDGASQSKVYLEVEEE